MPNADVTLRTLGFETRYFVKQPRSPPHGYIIVPARVLIADDEPVVADSMALILDQHGFETKAVYSGEAAVETAPSLRPDVLITDFLMGEMNGIETAMRISAIRPDCRLIIVSGNVGIIPNVLPGVEKRIGNPIEVLSKPLHPSLLLERLAGMTSFSFSCLTGRSSARAMDA